MRYLKTYKIFESIDSQFDEVYKSRRHGSEYDGDVELITDDIIEKLNNKNGNFKPSIIKDLFIDLFDDDILSHIKFTKSYYVENYITPTGRKSKNKYVKYIITVEPYFTESCNNYSKESCQKRTRYLEKRAEVIDILDEYYNHRNLNRSLSPYNIYDTIAMIRFNSFKLINDKFDLCCSSLDLNKLK